MGTDSPSYYAIIPANVRYADIPPNAKLLYGELTALSNKEGFCFATNSYFAKLYKVQNREVQRWIKTLISHNFISIKLEQNNTRSIFIGMTKMTPPYDKNDTPLLIYNNTSNNNILYKEKVKKEKENTLLPFLSKDFENVWNDFKQHRKLIKAPLTDLSIKKIFDKLKIYTEQEAIEMLNESILNNWRGVFEVRKFNSNKKPKSIQISNFDGQVNGFTDGSI